MIKKLSIIEALTFGMCSVLALMLAVNVWAMDIQGSHSGSWFNEAQAGHGFSFEVLDENKLVVYWFVYTPDGEPTFLVALADIQRHTALGTLRQYSGMRFGEFDPGSLSKETWGSISITFTGCNEATVEYSSTVIDMGQPYGSGTIDVTRLTGIHGLDCVEPQSLVEHGNYIANIMDGETDIGDAEIMILKNGAFAYMSAIPDMYEDTPFSFKQYGFGQLTMTSETDFDYVISVDYSGLGCLPDPHVSKGTGNFSKGGVTLEVPRSALSLDGLIDPAVYAGISLAQLAWTYEGTMPGDLIPRTTFNIAEDGLVTGIISVFSDYQVTGEVTIPNPGMNQFQLNVQMSPDQDTQTLYSSIGTVHGSEMDLITETRVNDEYFGSFEWTLSKQ